MNPDLPARLRPQLGVSEADLLVSVLAMLAERVLGVLGATLAGVYLKGSFALGSGDVHSDVDFLIATHGPLDAPQDEAVRDLHRVLPDQEDHWAHVLEGSYASLDDLRARADPRTPWLYVDNGNREMEWSTHDNTEVFRWVLHNRALRICGPDPATLIDDVPPRVLRHEAASLAVSRAEGIAADMDYLSNAWGQPHEVLTRCRLLYTATNAQVIGKHDAARWTRCVVPDEWHDLIDHAVADRPYPTVRIHQLADPTRAERTWEFIEFMAPLIAQAASRDDVQS
ncbi:MAG: aminoglycoside adenylyltransferase domain-containing protein [Nocardioides sp.]